MNASNSHRYLNHFISLHFRQELNERAKEDRREKPAQFKKKTGKIRLSSPGSAQSTIDPVGSILERIGMGGVEQKGGIIRADIFDTGDLLPENNPAVTIGGFHNLLWLVMDLRRGAAGKEKII